MSNTPANDPGPWDNVDWSEDAPLTHSGHRPYTQWIGEFQGYHMSVPGVGCLFPPGYVPLDPADTSLPWVCPVRDCRRSFATIHGLGGHFNASHRRALFNDNGDGTLSRVGNRVSPNDQGRFPAMIVCAVPNPGTAIDPQPPGRGSLQRMRQRDEVTAAASSAAPRPNIITPSFAARATSSTAPVSATNTSAPAKKPPSTAATFPAYHVAAPAELDPPPSVPAAGPWNPVRFIPETVASGTPTTLAPVAPIVSRSSFPAPPQAVRSPTPPASRTALGKRVRIESPKSVSDDDVMTGIIITPRPAGMARGTSSAPRAGSPLPLSSLSLSSSSSSSSSAMAVSPPLGPRSPSPPAGPGERQERRAHGMTLRRVPSATLSLAPSLTPTPTSSASPSAAPSATTNSIPGTSLSTAPSATPSAEPSGPVAAADWEAAPGRIRATNEKGDRDCVGFSADFLEHGEPYRIDTRGITLNKHSLPASDARKDFEADAETLRIGLVFRGRVVVSVRGAQSFEATAGSSFKIFPGVACRVENVQRALAVIYVFGTPEDPW